MLLPVLVSLTQAAEAAGPLYRGRRNELRVAPPRIEESVRVDGALDEPPWARAARLVEFSQYTPVDGRPAGNETEVLVWYSPSAIHFGIRAHAEPGTVRATLASRDRIDGDDQVHIFLSTFADGRQALVFGVNPLGVQADGTLVEGTARRGGDFSGLATGREPADLSPDYVFHSKGRLTEQGFEVEIRIPFESLRYPAAPTQDWGVHVVRRVQSTGHEQSWAPARLAASSFLAQGGTLAGLNGLRPGLVLDLNPVVTARAEGARGDSGWAYDAGAPEVGGNVRWGVTSNLTLNGTINPDFSQVEADVGQFVVDPRSALFFPEKRPFFLDGIEQFATPNRLVHTRRIVAPRAAAKLTGKLAGTSLAFLSAVDDRQASATGEDHPVFNLLRVQRDVGGQSKLGLVLTDKRDGDGGNTVAGLDARIDFAGHYRVQAQAAWSHTGRDGRGQGAPLWEAIAEGNGRRFGFRHRITGIHEDFRAESGFLSRGGIVHANLDHRLTLFGREGARVESFSTDVVLDGIWPYRSSVEGGGIQDKKLHLNQNATFRGGWKAGASVLIESFGYDEGLYTDYALLSPRSDGGVKVRPFVGTPHLPNLDYVLSFSTPQFQTFSANAFWLWGRDENFFEWASSDIVYLNLAAEWRPTEKLRVNADYNLQQFKRRTDGSLVGRRRIPRLKAEYQWSRSIFVRVVGEYDAQLQDDLRDDSRTELPIAIRDPATGLYERARGSTRNTFRADFLFSYQPTPGTVLFLGYGSFLSEPEALRFRGLRRTSDGLFFKLSYLFRL